MEDLTILHEDNHIIVVLKPQNVPTCEDASKDKDMLTMIKEYIKETYDKKGNVYCGLIHRLDRPTGGIMVFAKSSKAASRLSEQMREGDFEKRYYATVVGVPGRIVRINGEKVTDLEQEKRDPLQEEICHLREKVFELEDKLNKLIDR